MTTYDKLMLVGGLLNVVAILSVIWAALTGNLYCAAVPLSLAILGLIVAIHAKNTK